MHETDPTKRFSNRVENYVRYRPGYPDGLLACLRDEIGLRPSDVVADVGSGTGLFARILLENGNAVWGVEPNLEMRRTAESLLSGYPSFRSVDGTAEATTLAGASVDHRRVDADALKDFLGDYSEIRLRHEDDLDFEGALGRMLSSSYVPAPGHPMHGAIVAGLRDAFDRHQRDVRVRFLYDTAVYHWIIDV